MIRRARNSDVSHRVVIVGGGFGGLHAARALSATRVRLLLLDRRNFHLFQPLLYQVATGALSPANIAAPLRSVLKRQKNAEVLLAEARGFDLVGRRVLLTDGEIPYDSLIVAAGVRHHYFGHPDWEDRAPGLKTVEDATEMRRRIFLAFEAAERETDAAARTALMTFVIVGGGPTGVELAGALAEIARDTLRQDFRSVDPASAQIVLVEGADRILPAYAPDLSAEAAASLERLGVAVRIGALVTAVNSRCVQLTEAGRAEKIRTRTVFWAAGVQASPLAAELARASGAPTDRAGRLHVNADLTLPGYPEVFVIGDMASCLGGKGQPLPGVAPVAIQEGQFVAREIASRVRGKREAKPFRYRDYGSLATIGRAAAVAQFGRLHLSGLTAWLAWLFVHLMKLVQFENRLLVFVQWTWAYLSYNRSARLITGAPLLPAPSEGPCSCGEWLGGHGLGADAEDAGPQARGEA